MLAVVNEHLQCALVNYCVTNGWKCNGLRNVYNLCAQHRFWVSPEVTVRCLLLDHLKAFSVFMLERYFEDLSFYDSVFLQHVQHGGLQGSWTYFRALKWSHAEAESFLGFSLEVSIPSTRLVTTLEVSKEIPASGKSNGDTTSCW